MNLLPKATIRLNKAVKNNPFSSLKSYQRYNRVTNHPNFLGSIPVMALRVLYPGNSTPGCEKSIFSSCLGGGTKPKLWLQKWKLKATFFLVSKGYGRDNPQSLPPFSTLTTDVGNRDVHFPIMHHPLLHHWQGGNPGLQLKCTAVMSCNILCSPACGLTRIYSCDWYRDGATLRFNIINIIHAFQVSRKKKWKTITIPTPS